MDLLALAVPFFLLALLLEFVVDRVRGTGLYRANDAINSLSAGTLSTTFGYFTKVVQILLWGLVLEHLAVFEIPLAWFDASPRGIALWVTAAVAWDFCYYWNHRLGHEISLLWAAHAVHHQSEDYNLSTALRQTSTSFLTSWVFYVPLFVLGFPLEVVIAVGAVNLIYQFWVHTQIVRRLGVLDYIFVTPSNHRVHHAQNERYIDKNYGGIFILWDRLFGTFEDEREDDPVIFGVRKPLANWNPFWANLQVYDYLLFDARHTRRWCDKLGIWFRRTGWRPADMVEQYPKHTANLETFEKFDPEVPRSQRIYVLAQFFVAVIATLAIAVLFVEVGARGVLVPCVLLWTLLYTLGLINEGRSYAVRAELLRLVIVVPLAAFLLPNELAIVDAARLWPFVALYCGLSLTGLLLAQQMSDIRNEKTLKYSK